MGRHGKLFAICTLSALLLVSVSGCQSIEKLKARDRLNKGVAAYTEKKYPEAIGFFDESIRLDPDLTVARIYLATTYRTMYIPGATSPENASNADKAIQVYQEVLTKDPGNANVMASLARIYTDLGNYDSAKEWYRKRLEAEPSNPEPLYGIGSTNFNLVDPEIGTTGEKVKEMTPEKKAEVESLVDEGIDSLKKAMQLRNEYSEAAQFLNLLYRKKAALLPKEATAEKEQLLKEADQLAIESMAWDKKHKEEEAKAKKSMGGKAE